MSIKIGKKLKDRAKKFVDSLKPLSHKSRLTKIKVEINDLMHGKRKDGSGKKGYSTNYINTIMTYYSRLAKSEGMSLGRYFTVGYKAKGRIKRKYKRKLAKQQSSLAPIRRHKELIKKAVELLASDSHIDLICALCLLTGRRMTEVIKTAKLYKPSDGNTKIKFSGQLKKRDVFGSYEIYALGKSASKCKRAIKRLRSLVGEKRLKQMSETDVNKSFESSVNYKVAGLFGEFLGYATAHDLRRAYATICSYEHKPQNQTENSFIAAILGHKEDDLVSANSYQKYYIEK